MSDYETGREIAQRGWFLKQDTSEEMQRGYQSAIDEARQEIKQYRSDRLSNQEIPCQFLSAQTYTGRTARS